MDKVHDLKTWPLYFEAIRNGRKTFELRENDRGFGAGDILLLREWNPDTEAYTGRAVAKTVTFMCVDADGWGLCEGYVCMALADCDSPALPTEKSE